MLRYFLILIVAFTALHHTSLLKPVGCLPQEKKPTALTATDTIIKVMANPGSGFNYAYYLRLPKGVNTDLAQYLLVETNNSGNNDTLQHHEMETLREIRRNSLAASLCPGLKIPLLMPVFPRPAKEWQIYTHALDRDAALIKKGGMKRLDLQLIAMVEDARAQLKKQGIELQPKFLMNGFSASGTFANRFTLIHPELVAGTACGGINAIAVLCVDALEKTTLKYPLGTSDFKSLFGSGFNPEAYKKVPQFIYMGEKDNNDAVLYDDAYSDQERKIIFKVLGKTMLPARFSKCESVYAQNHVNAVFKVYQGIGHETDRKVYDEVAAFFNEIMLRK